MTDLIFLGKSARIALQMMQAARSSGDARLTVIGDAETAPLTWSVHCHQHISINFDGTDDARFCSIIDAVAARSPDAMLVPFDCAGIRMAGRTAGRLRIKCSPCPDLPTLEMLDDKWAFHGFCELNGLTVPASQRVNSKHALDFASVFIELGLPFVVKPTNCSGSQGVQIIRSEAQFRETILDNPAYNFAPLVVQQFIEGEDIDLSILAIHGKPACVAIQQAHGNNVTFLPNSHLENLASLICQASGFHGVMHVDARIERQTGKVFLIECNPRFWATLTATVWCGLNFLETSLRPLHLSGQVRVLNSGSCNMRHLLLQPSMWGALLSDRSATGRLLRARTFDFYALRGLFEDVPGQVASFFSSMKKVCFAPLRFGRQSSQVAAAQPFEASVLRE